MKGSPDSRLQQFFASGIRIPGKFCLWNPESWAWESEIQLKESGISVMIGIRNTSSTDKNWEFAFCLFVCFLLFNCVYESFLLAGINSGALNPQSYVHKQANTYYILQMMKVEVF